jgi:hypothetical protein
MYTSPTQAQSSTATVTSRYTRVYKLNSPIQSYQDFQFLLQLRTEGSLSQTRILAPRRAHAPVCLLRSLFHYRHYHLSPHCDLVHDKMTHVAQNKSSQSSYVQLLTCKLSSSNILWQYLVTLHSIYTTAWL